MLKKALFISLAASALMAGQFATLKDGRTIIMHDNGTWEEVQAVRSPDAQVAAMTARDMAQNPKIMTVSEPLARMLVGGWKNSDNTLAYDFRNDGNVAYIIDGVSKTESYIIQAIDSSDNTISVSIGDSSRYGKIIFGGLLRKLQISKDGKEMVDYSDEMSKLITVKLRKTNDAVDSVRTPKAPINTKEEISPKNGFVK
jgi:hypothetical protein